ncbi:MAG TPA: DUF167 domain-containing protein [Pyrinomonadaceae bacterium]|nr:DUF167 domain-containing protein [Pyrinomonadaceae bacterium]
MIECFEKDGKLLFRVHVTPRASRSEIVGEHNGALRVRLAAPPVEGAANEELVRTLASAFGLPTRTVEIVSGHSSRLKQVRVTGATGNDFAKLLS